MTTTPAVTKQKPKPRKKAATKRTTSSPAKRAAPAIASNRSLAQIRAEIEKLEAEASRIYDDKKQEAISNVRAKIKEFALTPRDCGFGNAASKAARNAGGGTPKVNPAKYRDPSTGKTWSGHGRRPKWMIDAQKRGDEDRYRI